MIICNIIEQFLFALEAKRRRKVIKSDHLACDHHRSMLVALSFLGPGTSTADGMFSAADAASLQANLTVLGLGGGLFPRFLYEKLPRVRYCFYG